MARPSQIYRPDKMSTQILMSSLQLRQHMGQKIRQLITKGVDFANTKNSQYHILPQLKHERC